MSNRRQHNMSSASSDTTDTYCNTPKVECLFVAKFDVKEGYKMIWSKSANNINTEGLEYKALPSGIHEFEATTIYLSHKVQGKLLYGLSRFRQLNLNETSNTDRDLVRMYSIGILLQPLKRAHWKPNEFANVGWEHLDTIDETLNLFLKDEKLAHIEALYDKLTGNQLEFRKSTPNPMLNHPLSRLPTVLSMVGPLIFPMYKAGLLRKRIMIFNHPSRGGDLIQEPNNRDHAMSGALAYLISLISVVPKDVQFKPNDESVLFSQPLYTVGLHDLDQGLGDNFIATTCDEILKYQKNLYDVGVIMPASDTEVCQVVDDALEPCKATFNDYAKFLKVYRKLPRTEQVTSDDLSSIRTYSSLFSAFRTGEDKTSRLACEPAWWLVDATSPMSWREYIWLAFAWFASAGTTQRNAPNHCLEDADSEAEEHRNTMRQQLMQLTMLVGHFHKLTKKWFYLIDEIVAEVADDKTQNQRPNGQDAFGTPTTKILLELTHQDIVDMELDPYSSQDLDFVKSFVLLYWGSVVEEVEIGMGFNGICC